MENSEDSVRPKDMTPETMDVEQVDAALAAGPVAEDKPKPSMLRWIIAAAVVLALAWPLVQHFLSTKSTDPGAVPGSLLQVSAQHYQAGQYKEAIDAAHAFLANNPNSADAYNNLAVSYLQLGQFDDAEHNIGEALRINPNFDLAKRNLNWIHQERDRVRTGAPAAGAPPAQARALLNTSLQHYSSKEFPECVAAAKAAIAVDLTYAEAWNNLAACETSQKHYDAAIAAASEAVRLKPDFQLARNNLAWAMNERAKK